ncbi:DUF4286 family protein [Microbacterium album]|uniref:DUF4286 family protein n=1 Tax=Microbacterium album TaxID=2053191 RepID=A0A917MMP3_9MICO|nr:DUF4286 family protein [Microbacterium album]GGH48421.1 hypothetical protein GCM10010921_25870 [Microbacterium album]
MTRARYVVGITPDASVSPEMVTAFADYYDHVHIPEVVAANAGFLSGKRWELIPGLQDGSPTWLTVYELEDESAADHYLARRQRATSGVSYTPGPVSWELMPVVWRALFREGPA